MCKILDVTSKGSSCLARLQMNRNMGHVQRQAEPQFDHLIPHTVMQDCQKQEESGECCRRRSTACRQVEQRQRLQCGWKSATGTLYGVTYCSLIMAAEGLPGGATSPSDINPATHTERRNEGFITITRIIPVPIRP